MKHCYIYIPTICLTVVISLLIICVFAVLITLIILLYKKDKNQTKLGEHLEDIYLAKTINEKHCCYGYNEQSAFVRCRYDKQCVKDKKSTDGDVNNACNDNGKDDNDGYDGANKDDGVKETK